jgi:four helix bundle protein
MKITRFEDIEGWQLARELTRLVYEVATHGEFAKDFGLRDQITRAAGSSMHNVAEGFDGGSNAELIKYLRYSQRSCSVFKASFTLPLIRDTSARRSLMPSTSKLPSLTPKSVDSSVTSQKAPRPR